MNRLAHKPGVLTDGTMVFRRKHFRRVTRGAQRFLERFFSSSTSAAPLRKSPCHGRDLPARGGTRRSGCG